MHWHFDRAQAYATSIGAHLATFDSAASNTAVYNMLGVAGIPLFSGWIGLRQAPGSVEPGGGWSWVTREPLTFGFWQAGCPNNAGCYQPTAPQDWVVWEGAQAGGETSGRWDDAGDPVPVCDAGVPYAVIEWSADCNDDGIVDYGQILAGELVDADGDNVPDCCEGSIACSPCSADVVEDGVVNAVDLSAVISAWGTDGGKLPRSDVDGNGEVDAADLAVVLWGWGPCP